MKKLALLLILAIAFTSCDLEDEVKEGEMLNGSWNLSKVYGMQPGYKAFSPGEVVWTFNGADNELIVEINMGTIDSSHNFAGLESGTYSYEIVESGEFQMLYVEEEEIGSIFLQPNLLKIDTGQAMDRPLLEFQR